MRQKVERVIEQWMTHRYLDFFDPENEKVGGFSSSSFLASPFVLTS